MTEQTNKEDIHDVIYLQYMVHDITWCDERITDDDIEYIRAEKYHELRRALQYIYDEWHNGTATTEFAIALDDAERVLGKEVPT